MYIAGFSLLLVIFLPLSATIGTDRSPRLTSLIERRWTGTVKMVEQYVGVTGKSERIISATFVDALPTLHRDTESTNLDFTDNKGTGSVKYKGEMIIEGRKFEETECVGSGRTELHEVVIDEADRTYRIEAIGPECVGTHVNLLDGSSTPYGPEVTSMIVSDQQLRDHNVLAGSLTETREIEGNAGTATITTTWNLVRSKPSDVELIVTPTCAQSSVPNCGYETWLPEPGPSELAPGSVMKVSLKLQGRNGRPLTRKAKAFELYLNGTSNEPGMTINFPISPNSQLPDLGFVPQPNAELTEKFQKAKINCASAGCSTAEIKVGSFDGGGWTMLTAVAILQEDDIRISGHLNVPAGETEITIPKRGANSKIAEAWLVTFGNPGESDDKEQLPGNQNKGDGLTAYEEYRGVISEGTFRRLDPEAMELGVRMNRDEASLFSKGIEMFEGATAINIIRFDESEIAPDRRLNRNFSQRPPYEQYVENLKKGKVGAAGENQPSRVTQKLPTQSDNVIIDIDYIDKHHREQSTAARTMGMTMPYTLAEQIANTVAHELAHGVYLDHHGPQSDIRNHTVPRQSVDVYHIFDEGRVEITESMKGSTLENIGKRGNEESGDLACIMAYTSAYNWVFRLGPGGSLDYYKVPLLPVGKYLCSSKNGGPLNLNFDDKYFGDATYGNCKSQIKLRT